MSIKLLVVGCVLVAACEHSEPLMGPRVDTATADAGTMGMAPMADPGVIDGPAVPIDAPAPVARTADEQFQDDVRRFAATTQRQVASWGTLHLDGSSKPYRFAGLSIEITAEYRPNCTGTCSSGYVIEEAPGRYWLVATWWTAWPFHAMEVPGAGDPPWEVLDDTWIQHDQIHNHGKETIAFGLRGGRLAVLENDDYHTRRDTKHRVYARDGVCIKKRCPALATFQPQAIFLAVTGPSATIAALPEPKMD